MYKTYARPYLDYASIIYSPHHLQLIDAVERVQRNFTKRLYGLRPFSYVERLRALDLESFELRRIRNDLVTLYKLLHGRIASSVSKAFKCNNVLGTRGHAFRLVKNRFRLDIKKHFFTCRVIDIRNNLDNDIVCASTLSQFICKLNNFDLSSYIRGRTLI